MNRWIDYASIMRRLWEFACHAEAETRLSSENKVVHLLRTE